MDIHPENFLPMADSEMSSNTLQTDHDPDSSERESSESFTLRPNWADPVIITQNLHDHENSGSPLQRHRSLTRPDRATPNTPMRTNMLAETPKKKWEPWILFSYAITCCIPSYLLTKFGGMPELEKQRAWREKVALCSICLMLCGALGFLTFGLQTSICIPDKFTFTSTDVATFGPSNNPHFVVILGAVYDMEPILESHAGLDYFRNRRSETNEINNAAGIDISPFFRRALTSTCQNRLQAAITFQCSSPNFKSVYCHPWENVEGMLKALSIGPVYYPWESIGDTMIAFDGFVLDMKPYLQANSSIFGEQIDTLIKSHFKLDSTKAFAKMPDGIEIGRCLRDIFVVGRLEQTSSGCWTSQVVLVVSFAIVMGLVMIRFAFAIFFRWFISNQLGKIIKQDKRTQATPQRRIAIQQGKTPITLQDNEGNVILKQPDALAPRPSLPRHASVRKSRSNYGSEVHTIMLVTCYSEDETALKLTFDSLAATEYNEDYKILFIIADGIIKGAGNAKSTPDLILGMLELDDKWLSPEPLSYLAVADGSKQHNKAKVYAGWYNYQEKSVPTVLIVKCGLPTETTKPGNRGKRDSQMILMRFLERITFNHRMCPLEYDLFQKMHYLMGVTPDCFQIILMVDADTKVASDSLARMVACMVRDPTLMGLCGETRIANKNDSWVSRIQVFEYYLSHHMTKAFESMFGGVTCLPGCFCMYRIKAIKGDSWVPILCSPEIITTYSQSVVDTLHKKNLLLLGEDRFLTTLMLRTFPRRKLIFVPRAYCKTTVPNTFSVLLSQRRRWINSTIHNLLELLLVHELCGIFCFSMQFVIFLELIGTVTLPAAICFTMYCLIN